MSCAMFFFKLIRRFKFGVLMGFLALLLCYFCLTYIMSFEMGFEDVMELMDFMISDDITFPAQPTTDGCKLSFA